VIAGGKLFSSKDFFTHSINVNIQKRRRGFTEDKLVIMRLVRGKEKTFKDKQKTAGVAKFIVKDNLMGCGGERSMQEVIKELQRIIRSVALFGIMGKVSEENVSIGMNGLNGSLK
jgi:hypothetical protein